MGMIRRLLALVVLLCGAALAGTAAYTYFYARPAELPANANIVVLSAGLADGQMDGQTAERTAAGIALYQQLIARGETPLIIMSGGRSEGDPASKATLMSDAARDAGIPVGDIRVDVESHSTLQNALFTQAALGEAATGPLIVVTHRYHLPRAGASFWWAGMEDVTLYSADAADEPPVISALVMEGLKWPFNAARAGIYSGLVAAGMDADTLQPFLR